MADKGFDPTLKDLVESGPDDWPLLLDRPPAPTTVIDADIATVSGAWAAGRGGGRRRRSGRRRSS